MPRKKLVESPFIKYTVQDVPGFEKFNEKNLPVIIEALKAIHINLSITDNEMSLFIPASYYNEYHNRNAGRRKKIMSKSGEYEVYELYGKKKEFYSGDKLMYSDILPLMLKQSDAGLIKQLNIPRATYYRHKKALMDSQYYKSIPKEKMTKEFALSDEAEGFFKSIDGDMNF
ncbi:MAG: hypothetical protein IKP88_17735 [Lachnospiraceae bacterium]|nr:hypothetical protein [Lachnospiraceae bacterium]